VPNDYQIITPTVPKTGGADTAGGDKVFVPGTPVAEVTPTVPPSPTTPGTTGGGGGGGGSGVNSPAGVGETGATVTQPGDMGGGAGTGTGSGAGDGSGVGTGTGSGTGGGTGSGTGTGTGSGTGSGTGGGTGINIGTGTGTGTGTGVKTTGVKTTGVKTTGTGGGYNYNQSSQDMYGGIRNLAPGLTDKLDYTLSGLPNIQENMNPIPQFATGSSVDTTTTSASTYDPFNTGTGNTTGISSSLTPGFTKAKLDYILAGMPGANIVARAEGGQIGPEGHNPSFFSEGGLNSIENRYVQGEGDGTSDSVAAMLANGEFVIPADVVSKLGNGSNEAGASVLDQFLVEIRKHAHSNGEKLPPESKGPLGYLLDAKRKVKV